MRNLTVFFNAKQTESPHLSPGIGSLTLEGASPRRVWGQHPRPCRTGEAQNLDAPVWQKVEG